VVLAGEGVTAADQSALDAAVFYLLSSAHPKGIAGLPIAGYSCLEYGGRMFWDADTWMLPPLALLDKDAGAAVAAFRGRTLQMARNNAALYGFRGAMYAWETSERDGHGAALAPTGWSEHHITVDVANGVWYVITSQLSIQ
jgi:trehalose/maltose hydrolase-like predicted phosphorylase